MPGRGVQDAVQMLDALLPGVGRLERRDGLRNVSAEWQPLPARRGGDREVGVARQPVVDLDEVIAALSDCADQAGRVFGSVDDERSRSDGRRPVDNRARDAEPRTTQLSAGNAAAPVQVQRPPPHLPDAGHAVRDEEIEERSSYQCTCMSQSPGIRYFPLPSIVAAPAGTSDRLKTHRPSGMTAVAQKWQRVCPPRSAVKATVRTGGGVLSSLAG